MRVLSDVFTSVSKPGKAGAARDVLTLGFPRLAQLLEATFERLCSETTMKGVLPAVNPDQLPRLLACASPFESAYRAACLARMSDAVASAFPGGSRSLPSPADVQNCIGVLHEELRIAGNSSSLASIIAGEVSTALTLLAKKAEVMAASGPDVRTVPERGPANPSQLRNLALCSQLQEVHRSLSGLLPRLPASASAARSQAVAVEAIAPLFKSVMESLEERIMRMHSIPYDQQEASGEAGAGAEAAEGATGGSGGGASGGGAGAGVVETSPYILECTLLMANFRAEYLSKLVPPPSPAVPSCAAALVERMASRLLLLFARHASLVRPLGGLGKLQLAKDLAELQLAVGQSLYPLEQLTVPYRVVKALRAMLFRETSAIVGSPLLRDLPAPLALFHLFSRLPNAVLAPHQRSGLTLGQYSLWLDEHDAGQVLASVGDALDAAEAEGKLAGADPQVVAAMRAMCGGGAGLGGL